MFILQHPHNIGEADTETNSNLKTNRTKVTQTRVGYTPNSKKSDPPPLNKELAISPKSTEYFDEKKISTVISTTTWLAYVWRYIAEKNVDRSVRWKGSDRDCWRIKSFTKKRAETQALHMLVAEEGYLGSAFSTPNLKLLVFQSRERHTPNCRSAVQQAFVVLNPQAPW